MGLDDIYSAISAGEGYSPEKGEIIPSMGAKADFTPQIDKLKDQKALADNAKVDTSPKSGQE